MKAKVCDSCNSEIITYRIGSTIVAECSYCGKPAEIHSIDDYAEELDEEE